MKKQGPLLLGVVSFVLVAFVIVYMGYHVGQVLKKEVPTVQAVTFTVEDTISTNGYFVREELLIPKVDGIAEATIIDGARVAKGDDIYALYRDQLVLSDSTQLRELDRRIADMEYAQGQISGAMDATHMDLLIFTRLADMHDARERRQQLVSENNTLEFKSLIFKREYTYGQGEALDNTLESLRAQAASLRVTQRDAVSAIKAPVSGLFTTQVDGYEGTITKEVLDTLTVEEFQTLGDRRSTVDMGTSMGKLALGFYWYHVVVLPWEEAKLLTVGQTLTMRFADVGYSEVTFKVDRIAEPEGQEALVVLSSNQSMADFLNVRRLSADVLLRSYTGLRVPRDAIWQDPDSLAFGVYCLMGNRVIFKPVEILTDRDNYYLVAFNALTATTNDLLPGDEMITKATDIYNGKVYLQS